MSCLNTVVYLCKEVFDENSQPTQIEIEEQASRLGIDIVKEIHLLSIAKQCLLEPLPDDWVPCYIKKENKYFYYNKQSKISQWEHPLDEYYRQIVEKTRSEDCSTGQDISLNVILDEENLLDTTMYHHSKNSNYEKKTVAEKRTVRFKTPIEESLDLDESEDNMKFLGPIKLNTPFTNTSSTLHNLPQFSTTNTYDIRNTASRSVLSKYNILPSKDEQSKKSELVENIKKTIYEDPTTNLDYTTGKENLRKIDITLTESSDRSESTSSEIQTDNLNSDYEDQKEKDNIITSVQLNKRHEKIDTVDDDIKSAIDNFNEFQSIGTAKSYNIKKDDLVSDSGNSTAKDSKIIQSSIASNSLSATKNKMTEITQRFPLNQFSNETKLFKRNPSDEGIFDVKSNCIKSKIESENNLEHEKSTLLDDAHIKIKIEKHCDLLKNELENTIRTNQDILREELIKKIDDVIQKQNDNFEKHIEVRHNELISKNESQLKNIQENTGKSLIEECDKKYIEHISNTEQMYADNLKKFKKDLEDYTDLFKHKIQSDLDIISNELKKDFAKNIEIITDGWNQTLGSNKNDELAKAKHNFEQSTENIKREMELEMQQFHVEFNEKLKIISEDKLNSISEKLDMALREEIDLVKKRVNESSKHDINNKTTNHTSQPIIQPKLCNDCPELNLKCQNTDTQRINYSDIRKKIQHCSNELNDLLKLVNEISSTNEKEHNTNVCPDKCSVSCQTENITNPCKKSSLKEYIYPAESSMSMPDVNTKYANYLSQAKMSDDLYSNYLTPYSQQLNYSPLHILSQQELKVKAAEQNICRLIETFNNFKHDNINHIPNNTNISDEYKFTNIYQALTPKQIAFNRTKHLREWLYSTDSKNKNN
ncbi:protein PFC0760c isoform X2 [Rhopalosiphum maidis]|uniref:protein PFC0760c isoform X2 n=1 Tax=Rhopalosiphum maidis TaxID=43146 RepID=UPI000EFFB6D7|nr:protein PFC0760c isoform X2 [Rhopalosiphum maidis]